MTHAELLREILRGSLLVVGEYRGSRAELAGYVDRKTGEAIHYIRAIHLIECLCRGLVDRAIIMQRLPEIFETVEEAEAAFRYVRGRKYAFFLESMRWERGQVTGWIGAREPQEIAELEEGCAAPSGAAHAP